MASDRLATVGASEQRTRSRIRLDLVGLKKISQVIVEGKDMVTIRTAKLNCSAIALTLSRY
jgi:hypothetical protein